MAEDKRLGYDGIMELMDRLARDAERRDREAEKRHKEAMEREAAALKRDEAALKRDEAALKRDKAALKREEAALKREEAALLRDEAALKREIELRERIVEETKRLEASRKEHEEAIKRLKKLEGLVGGISHNTGFHAEEFFQNALEKTLSFGGIKFDKLIRNLSIQKKVNCEFDIALVNGDSVALIEAKNRVHPDDLKVLTTKKLEQFRRFFPVYANYRVYLGVAGFSFADTVTDEAHRLGVGIVRQDGDSIEEDAGQLSVF